jgi:sulfide:quinone oxidoreductase
MEIEMADVRRVTEHFAVAPQLEPDDLGELKAAGFRRVISNRPDEEAPPGAKAADIKRAAEAAGLEFVHVPFVGPPSPGAIEAATKASGPTVAYCRSGTRSVTAWAMSQAGRGAMSADEITEAAARAGYNLAGLKDALRQLGAR